MTASSSATAPDGLGVLRSRTGSRPRLTDDDKLLVLAQAVVGSYLRYGAYPYAIAVREYVDERRGRVIEHRFVGLFTVAAMNADVLEIPTISRQVREALAMADNDPVPPGPASARRHPDHPALGAVHAERRTAFHDGQSGRGSGIATARVAVPARRSAAVLRLMPGLRAPRPLHHARCGCRSRTSWSANSAGRDWNSPLGSVNHLGR